MFKFESDERDAIIKRQADVIIFQHKSVREVAKLFGVSKSTIYQNMSVVLPKIDSWRWANVKRVFKENRIDWHLKGGLAMKMKYENEKFLPKTAN